MRLLLLFFGVITLYTACQYPYHTPQARRARREARLMRQTQRQTPAPDTTRLDSPKTVIATPTDTVPPLVSKDNKMRGNTTTQPQDSLLPTDSLPVIAVQPTDSLPLVVAAPDTFVVPQRRVITFSKDSLPAPVQYSALDSMIYDIANRKVYLYGGAEVYFEQYSLKAGFIVFDFNTNVATAEGVRDSTGQDTQRPLFSDGNQTFDARKIMYNFKSKKGKIFDAATQFGDGYFIAQATKFIARDAPDATDPENDVVYSKGGIYTTCNHYHPHFGIRVSRSKLIPNKVIVAGPAYLEIMGIPTPIALPFGFFPIKSADKRKSGLIISTDLEFSPSLGLGIKGLGYYWGIGEFMDLSITGDVYLRGSFRLRASSRYNKRYKGNGAIELGYSRLRIDEKGNPDYSLSQDFNFRWSHTQDAKAHPNQSFQASVNFGTSSYFRNTTNNADDVLRNAISSNISFTKRFPGTPVSLTVSFQHTQNTQNRSMSITFPRLDVRVNRITPFRRKKQVGKERWYERIGFSYNFAANNTLQTIDTVFFQAFQYGNIQEDILDKMEYSVRHSPALDFSFKLFKYINVQPSVNYNETWYFYRNEKKFDNTLTIQYDTVYDANNPTVIAAINADTTFGEVIDAPRSETYGFYPVRDLSAGVNINTQIFAIGRFRAGNMPSGESHKVRLTLRPSVGFQWRPDYSKKFWGYYDSVQTDTRYPTEMLGYRRFPTVPSAGASGLLNYALTAVLDGKFWSRKLQRDTTRKAGEDNYIRAILINNISLSGNYNLLADSLNISPLSLRANTTLFKYLGVTFSATFDPYAASPDDNRRINTFQWNVTKELMRTTEIFVGLSTGFGMRELREVFTPKKAKAQPTSTDPNKAPDLFQNFRINYNLRFTRKYINGIDSTEATAHELSLSGTINLSKGWNIIIGRIGYDFKNKRITYPDFTFSRDLHCWQMGVTWQPERQTWAFYLRVRPGSLGFINMPVRKNFYDPF